MSRGRPRHHGSRRRAYHARQREVRERRVLTNTDAEVGLDDGSFDDEPTRDEQPLPALTLRLQGRPAAA